MEDFGMILIILVAGTYVMARISSATVEIRQEKLEQLKEAARKRHVDALYGRYEENDD